MSIGPICDRLVKISETSKSLQLDIENYCNEHARKLLKSETFSFVELPSTISKAIYNGTTGSDLSWSSFLKQEVRAELGRLLYRFDS